MVARLVADHGRVTALVAGALLPLGFAPFGAWWLAIPLLAVLFLAWEGQGGRERFLRGFLFGFGAFAAGTYWLYISIHGFGGAAPPFAIAAMLLLITLMAVYHGVAGWLAGRWTRHPAVLFLATAPGAFTLLEWLRGRLFSGFPWLSLGYGQVDGPLASWAPVAGVHGLTLATVLLAGALAALLAGPARRQALATIAVLLATTALLRVPQWTLPEGEPLSVALVQGGIGQEKKWLPEEREGTLKLYLEMTVELKQADLVIWPEAAVPALAYEVADYLKAIRELAKARDMTVLLGVVTLDFDTDSYFNSLLALGEESGVYHKRHLVPFGEYFPVPGFVRDMLRLMNLPYQDISSGPADQAHLRARGVRLAPTICYEDVFGSEVRDFLPAAGLLVNVSNDGWFGDSIAPHQHLQMARMRALESGRFMLRSTNTGVSAIIGPSGEVIAKGPQFRPATVTALAQPRTGATPYVTLGDGPVVLLSTLLAAAGVIRLRGRPAGRETGPR